ncbi:DEAD/DEAH box helicase [Microbacterium algeriense]|uniref:DEAD/DEAH box helicase n=1 Tax=Microbacterium algeriense TaxID=2615184 RepID=A0ABQ6V7T8_9MICO|nr:DEAD/DEAH box helicase [Microbacterium algeriense]
MLRVSHYESDYVDFALMRKPGDPAWRRPQVGALAAISSQWTLEPEERLLVSIPTGSGKTAIATALPYLARAKRTLVVVPSTELRGQLSAAFRSQQDLLAVGALNRASPGPIVEEVKGRNIDWSRLQQVDVVVALPNSISPDHMDEADLPDPGLFDLLIIDEAHHAPAKTWRAILDHFPSARAVLLTATPRRADGKLLPGTHAYHFPLRAAIAEGIFHSVLPRVLELGSPITDEAKDEAIAAEVASQLSLAEHATSVALIRVNTVARAGIVQAIYARKGVDAQVLIGSTSIADREDILGGWRAGRIRAVVAVDMLGEGVNVPNLRIVGYHDKHKSTPATMQFIGRLARANAEYPQQSVLVTVHDEDVYPALQGALRELYREDADWATILPTLIDEEIERERRDREYLSAFDDPPESFDLAAVKPLTRAVLLEVPRGVPFDPGFGEGVPDGLQAGQRLLGRHIAYAGLNQHATQLVIITSETEKPKWYSGTELTRSVFELAVVSWQKSADINRSHLLLLNAQDLGLLNAIREILDPSNILRNGNPGFLQEAFDSVERLSVSSVGVRNTFAAVPGTPAYATFAGSGIDRGLREADTNGRGLGHAMAQVRVDSGQATTAGLAVNKSKYWETRYLGLRDYEAFVVDLARRYWFPRPTESGPLLPNVSKGARTDEFHPPVIAVELNPALLGASYTLPDGCPIEELEIAPLADREATQSQVFLRVYDPRDEGIDVWTAEMTVNGKFTTLGGSEELHRGMGNSTTFNLLFEAHPPLIYFGDGRSTMGPVTFQPPRTESFLPDVDLVPSSWESVDITRETPRPNRTDSIHEWVQETLVEVTPEPGASRWVLHNDGGGEIADHVVIQRNLGGRMSIELWHSKPSSNSTPGVRVTDMEVVTQQAAKSRRHLTDRQLWNRIGRRLTGAESPRLTVLAGDREDLLALCGLLPDRSDESIAERPPHLDSKIVIVQPGLSVQRLQEGLHAGTISAGQVREFLVFFHNAVGGLARTEVRCSS